MAQYDLQRSQEMHRKALANINSRTDSSAHHNMPESLSRSKKWYLQEERNFEIHRDNNILLQKLNAIFRETKPSALSAPPTPVHSLNWFSRKKELEKIMSENEVCFDHPLNDSVYSSLAHFPFSPLQALLQRLLAVEPATNSRRHSPSSLPQVRHSFSASASLASLSPNSSPNSSLPRPRTSTSRATWPDLAPASPLVEARAATASPVPFSATFPQSPPSRCIFNNQFVSGSRMLRARVDEVQRPDGLQLTVVTRRALSSTSCRSQCVSCVPRFLSSCCSQRRAPFSFSVCFNMCPLKTTVKQHRLP